MYTGTAVPSAARESKMTMLTRGRTATFRECTTSVADIQ